MKFFEIIKKTFSQSYRLRKEEQRLKYLQIENPDKIYIPGQNGIIFEVSEIQRFINQSIKEHLNK